MGLSFWKGAGPDSRLPRAGLSQSEPSRAGLHSPGGRPGEANCLRLFQRHQCRYLRLRVSPRRADADSRGAEGRGGARPAHHGLPGIRRRGESWPPGRGRRCCGAWRPCWRRGRTGPRARSSSPAPGSRRRPRSAGCWPPGRPSALVPEARFCGAQSVTCV